MTRREILIAMFAQTILQSEELRRTALGQYPAMRQQIAEAAREMAEAVEAEMDRPQTKHE